MTQKEIIHILKEEELNLQSAYAGLFPLDLVYRAYARSEKIHGITFEPVFAYLSFAKLTSFFQILLQKKINAIAEKIYKDYYHNPESLEQKMRAHSDLTLEFQEIWSVYQKQKKNISRKEHHAIYNRFIKTASQWWSYGVIGEDKGGIIERQIIPQFQSRHQIHQDKAREIVNTLSHPEEQTAVNKARKLFLEICLQILESRNLAQNLKRKNFAKLLSDKALGQNVQKYLLRFFWLKTNFYEAPEMTAKTLFTDLLKEIKRNPKTKIQQEIKQIDANFHKIQARKKLLRLKIKLSLQDRKDLDFARKIILWIELRKVGMMRSFYYLFSFLADLSSRFAVDYHRLALQTVRETENFIKSGKVISEKEMQRREDSLFIVYTKGKPVQMIYGQEGFSLFQIVRRPQKDILKGIVACRGQKNLLQGKIRIIKNLAKDRLEQDEVLVTSMTRNEIVPLMRKAKAIITDEGGLACHAAIVSRELNVPCIIGTKIATQTLENGDRVEMDLLKGIIRILK